MELQKLKTLRTAFLIILGMITWNSVISWWSNWLTLALLVIDMLCVLITFVVTKSRRIAPSDKQTFNSRSILPCQIKKKK